MDDIGDFIDAIRRALEGVARDAQQSGSGFEWTSEVKRAVREIVDPAAPCDGENTSGSRYSVYGHKREKADCTGEWLFDLCWLDYVAVPDDEKSCKKYLRAMPLAMESEFGGPEEVCDDFGKLLVARAALKVMVFSDKNQANTGSRFGAMRRQIKAFEGIGPDGEYLLCCWCNDTEDFTFDHVPAA
ncbi:hypothetical protein [Oceanibacterium hippocampi]|uniref:Uncharacterized protein n=1 Tax=Oceanibacterium hippocampi TaxID=745714 RepID=A0A1Y5S2L8_9PROT|nr:hypothetical protein [Oceanibacterium hippocampi]SLN30887.1 hypothetical protein OCH7691_01089 [Oceanibacterium hippocampi]